MKELFLCGHTGSDNRGCEAIVRSTIDLFYKVGFDKKPVLATFAPLQDTARNLHAKAEIMAYSSYSCKAQRVFYAGIRKVFKSNRAGQNIIQHNVWKRMTDEDLCLNIGGDTYCYGKPTVSMALNKHNLKNKIPSLLWGCTVEAECLSADITADLKRYSLIVARENLTVESLVKAGIDKSRIICCCDPAFTLETTETALPENFVEGNTVGVNISELVFSNKLKESLDFMVKRIMEDTDMNICFIPHVYNAKEGTGDIKTHRKLLSGYMQYGKRISVVSEDLSCTELKYIISKCRFFMGARTHSVIAAYSSGVPALALGYSMKSAGIATDIFSKSEGYVVHYNDVKSESDLYNAFMNIVNNEENIRVHYSRVMPGYKKTVEDTAKTLLERYLK